MPSMVQPGLALSTACLGIGMFRLWTGMAWGAEAPNPAGLCPTPVVVPHASPGSLLSTLSCLCCRGVAPPRLCHPSFVGGALLRCALCGTAGLTDLGVQ